MLRGLITLLLLAGVLISAQRLFYLMGTYAYIELPTQEEVYRAYRILKSLEDKLSDYKEDSEISLVNSFAGVKPVRVSPETFEVIKIALEVSRKTYGYFDITYGAVSINHKRLGKLSYEEAKALVNYRNVKLGEGTVFLPEKGMAIDLGGIGKGYAVEVAYRKLRSPYGFIGIAGDMKVWGEEKVIAVKDPLRGGSLLQGVTKGEVCLSTSGNYHKEHIEQRDGKLVQITVAHKNCTYADAFATALFAMPLELRRKFERENPDVGIVELYGDGSIYINSGFRNFFSALLLKDEIKSQ
ncbi:MAG: FAD:protein FMN transferase [Aquificae bacterium]|nr:FAD:protein FMN transferase [Aquificota bacterium]